MKERTKKNRGRSWFLKATGNFSRAYGTSRNNSTVLSSHQNGTFMEERKKENWEPFRVPDGYRELFPGHIWHKQK